ncbi:MAG TPA: hypothetical protein VD905_13205 [Flavobacteriales bacterium]|nr:hypothetical protein [Flavobacteriales bacterium]
MKTFRILLPLSVLFALLAACNGSRQLAATGKDAKHALKVTRVPDFTRPENHRPVTIEDWTLEGDIAKLAISYSGGCGEHSFNAFFDGKYMKSLPPRAGIFIQHNHGEDNCRKLIMDTLYIDLAEIRYNANAGSVIVGFDGSDKTLEYSYKAK